MSKPKQSNEKVKALPSRKLNGNDESPYFDFSKIEKKHSPSLLEGNEVKAFMNRLVKLSELTWLEINQCDRHSYGTEEIHKNFFKPSTERFPKDVEKIKIFRRGGKGNAVMAGYRKADSRVFVIFWVEKNHGDLYSV